MKLRRKPRTQIKLREAAELLQISRSSVRNLIADGTLQKVQVARRQDRESLSGPGAGIGGSMGDFVNGLSSKFDFLGGNLGGKQKGHFVRAA